MIRLRHFLALGLVAVGMAGCKSTYSTKNVTTAPPPLLRNTSRIYVAVPFDAAYKKKVAQGSGKKTADVLFAAIGKYSKYASMSKYPESVSEAIDSARERSANYLIYPAITKWEDHDTEWSGRRDRLQIKVDLIDLADSQVVFSREISATGKWLTEGGDTPADLLSEPLEEYVNALFRRVETPSALQ